MVDARTEHYIEYTQCFVPLLERKKGAVTKKLKQIKEQYNLCWSDYDYVENSSLRSGKYCQTLFRKYLVLLESIYVFVFLTFHIGNAIFKLFIYLLVVHLYFSCGILNFWFKYRMKHLGTCRGPILKLSLSLYFNLN